MQKNITPLPWQASHNTGSTMRGYSQSSCITGTGPHQLQIIAGCFSDIGGRAVAEANAEFIARAANNHDKLVAILKKLVVLDADPAKATPAAWNEAFAEARIVLGPIMLATAEGK